MIDLKRILRFARIGLLGEIMNIEKEKLPENAEETDVLRFKDGKYEIDYDEKRKIQERISSKLESLFEE